MTDKAQHTFTHWTVAEIGSNLYVQDGPDTDICLVYRPYPKEGENASPEYQAIKRQANARLIAAAPQLVEALNRICEDPYTTCYCNEIARAALALVEGGDK